MSSDIGAELRVGELGGLDDRQLWQLGAAVVARLHAAIRPVAGDDWEPGVSAVSTVWAFAAASGDGSRAELIAQLEAVDVEAIESRVGGKWLLQAFKVAVLNLLDPGDLAVRVSMASGSAVGAWEMFAEYEMANDGELEWADKYSSLPVLVEIGAQRTDLAMVQLAWDPDRMTSVLESRAVAVGSWQAERVVEMGGGSPQQ